MRFHPVVSFLFVCLAVSTAWAQPLGTGFTYQGRLKNGGSPAYGSFNMDFKLYPVPAGGTQLASQTLPGVSVSDGLFTVQIDFGAGVFDGNQRWLDVTVDGTPLVPRQELSAAPHAVFASNADQLDGLNSSAFLTGVPNPLTLTGTNASSIITGHNQSAVSGAAGVSGLASGASGQVYGVVGSTASTQGFGVFGSAPATSGSNFGGRFESDSSNGTGVFGEAKATTGTNYGVYGKAVSPNGFGVYSEGKMHATGVISGNASGLTNFPVPFSLTGSGAHVIMAQNTNPDSGVAVLGLMTAGTGGTIGGRFESASDEGIGVLGLATTTMANGYTSGVHGQAASSIGRGVFGRATSASGENYGVWGESDSNTGTGVYGRATYGVRGESVAPGGVGVYGVNYSSYFTDIGVRGDSVLGTGVYGYSSHTFAVVYGVRGEVTSPDGYGVYSQGNMGASGTKAFRIDHPDDPSNKYLLHYAAESPEVINFYRGTVVLNGAGEAVVELPHYFAKINTAPSYQLTAIGAPMPMLHVADVIDEAALSAGARAEPGEAAPKCSFRIAGGAAGSKVSWRVESVRNDRWVKQRGAPVEVEKQGLERGTYQHPDLYGQPSDKGMNFDATHRHTSSEHPEPPTPAESVTDAAATASSPG